MISRIADLIRNHRSFLVTTHRNPDGDAAGCLTGLGRMLQLMDKEFVLYSPDPLPPYLRFLPLSDKVRTTLSKNAAFEITVAVDVADANLLGLHMPKPPHRGTLVAIDHHLRHKPFGDVTWRDPETAAVGVMLYHLAVELNIPEDTELAEALWCSIYTDTGGFRYAGTNPEALRICAHLLEQGVDAWKISTAIYESNPAARVHLLARVLDTLTLSADGKVALITVTRAMLDEAGLDASMLDTFINHARGIEGVEVAVQLRQRGNGWKVSMRSKGNLDVSAVAVRFGGGGHRNAAGCSLEGSLEQARSRILEAASAAVAEHNSP